MILRVDTASAIPLFEQLAASVRAEAAAGGLSAGERLPAARDVAESLGVNVHTVLKAYQDLRDEGLIELRRGRGAVVTDRVVEYARLSRLVTDLAVEARRLDLTAATVTALIRKELSS